VQKSLISRTQLSFSDSAREDSHERSLGVVVVVVAAAAAVAVVVYFIDRNEKARNIQTTDYLCAADLSIYLHSYLNSTLRKTQ